jgi:hypothetical protein
MKISHIKHQLGAIGDLVDDAELWLRLLMAFLLLGTHLFTEFVQEVNFSNLPSYGQAIPKKNPNKYPNHKRPMIK